MDGGGGLMNGLTWQTAWGSCLGGVEAGAGNGCAAEPNTLATIWEGVMPTAAGAPG